MLLLIRYQDNWADEMDITGLAVVDIDQWLKIQIKMKDLLDRKSWTYGIGTNEEIEYSSYSDWLASLTIVAIPNKEQSDTLVGLLKMAHMGPCLQCPELLIQEGFFPLPWPDEFDDEDEE